MPKPRDISSVEAGLSLAIKNNKDKVMIATGKSESYLRKCSDPNLPQQLDHKDAIKIDRACIEAGLMPYLFEAHRAIIVSELKKIKGSNNCWEISKLSDGGKGAPGRLYLLPSTNGT